MLKEALEQIAHQAVQADHATVVQVPGLPEKVFISHQGTLQEHDVPPGRRDYRVLGVSDFLSACTSWGGDASSIFVAADQIVLLVDDNDRRDRVILPLHRSQQFSTLDRLPSKLDQAAFVELLRHDLRGVVPDTLLAQARKMQAASSGNRTQDLSPGRERGTSEFMNELVGADALPDVVTASVSVYSTPGAFHADAVSMTLKCCPSDLSFTFKPLPDEIENASNRALARLHEMIGKQFPNIKVVRGTALS